MAFLDDYAYFTKETESPEIFHLFGGLYCLSAAVSRKIWLDLGLFQIYPNIYVILLGEPGGGKSTAMNAAKNLLYEFGYEKIPLSPESQTRRSIINEMAENVRAYKLNELDPPTEYAPLNICVTEFSQFIAIEPAVMLDFLTTIYDERRFRYKTATQGETFIIGPHLNLLGCTTPDWIARNMKSDIITGGFSRRAFFVLAEETKRIPRPVMTDKMLEARQRCLTYLTKVLDIKGPVKWSPEAAEFYDHWYSTRTFAIDPNVRGFSRRKSDLVCKLAMLFCLNEGFNLTLTKQHIEQAMAMTDAVEENLARVFQGMGRNELNQVAGRVLEMLRAAPNNMLPEAILKQEIFRDADPGEITKIILHLQETNKIKRMQQDPKTLRPGIKPKTFIVLVKEEPT